MFDENALLFTFTVKQYKDFTKELVTEILKEKDEVNNQRRVNNSDKEEHFNIAELAAFLKCSKVSIHSYKKSGLPFYRIGRKVLFKKTEVLNFMKGLKNKRNKRI